MNFAAQAKEGPRIDADGLQIRVLNPNDIDEIAALFARLSSRSRYLRFMSPVRTVSAGMLSYLAAVDHHRHEAVGAFEDDLLMGAMHYFQSATDPTRAEIAGEVSDPYQQHGVGSRLLRELGGIARRSGITHFDSRMLVENTAAISMVRHLGWRTAAAFDGPELAIAMTIPQGPMPCV
ncbi:MAG TPA: GNAT family N-acetyltransferase [Acidimicrobiales bacterium]|jgi:acetyltransferase|nr:GNAT family N-acetyltransferase [Acidimicrobiales bacterium]